MDTDKAHRMGHLQPYQVLIEDRVASARDHWQHATHQPNARYDDFILWQLTRAEKTGLLSLALADPRGSVVTPVVNHNRWVGLCECGGAETVDPSESRFYCFSCFNVANDGYPRPVVFDELSQAVEEALVSRTDCMTRNWVPTETVADLEAENVINGLAENVRVLRLGG